MLEQLLLEPLHNEVDFLLRLEDIEFLRELRTAAPLVAPSLTLPSGARLSPVRPRTQQQMCARAPDAGAGNSLKCK